MDINRKISTNNSTSWSSIPFLSDARIRALAAAWARNDYDLSEAFLQNRSLFGLVEVLKALTLLDSGRQIRVIEKKVKRLQLSGTKVSKKKMGKLKSDIDNLNAIKPPVSYISWRLTETNNLQ